MAGPVFKQCPRLDLRTYNFNNWTIELLKLKIKRNLEIMLEQPRGHLLWFSHLSSLNLVQGLPKCLLSVILFSLMLLIFIDKESTRLLLINWPRSPCPVNGRSEIWTSRCGPRICVSWKAFSLEMTSRLCLECLYLVWQNDDWVLSPWFSRQISGVKVKKA